MSNDKKYYIWCHERQKWWLGFAGYTSSKEDAFKFSFEDALHIVTRANIRMSDVPEESMVPAFMCEE